MSRCKSYGLQYLLVGMVMALCSCRTMRVPDVPLVSYRLQKLTSLDLSEDRGALASGNDELLLVQSVFRKKNGVWKVNHAVQEILVNQIDTSVTLNLPVIDELQGDSVLLTLMLVELDMEGSVEAFKEAFGQGTDVTLDDRSVTLEAYHQELVHFWMEERIDDDVLGIKKLDHNPPETIHFDGVHLFDRYAYELTIERKVGVD